MYEFKQWLADLMNWFVDRNLLGVVLLGLILGLVALYILLRNIPLWLRAKRAGSPITLARMLLMSFRRLPTKRIVEAHLRCLEHDIDVTINDLEVSFLAGLGDVDRVIETLTVAKQNGIRMNWHQASALGMVGHDPMIVVTLCIEKGITDASQAMPKNLG